MSLLRLIHAWAGTFLCLLLAVLGLSGSLLVYKNDYVRASVPNASAATSHDAVSFAKAMTAIEAIKGQKDIRFVVLAHANLNLHEVGYSDKSAAYTDPDGIILSAWQENGRFEVWLLDLHHHLLNGDSGEIVAGFAGLMAVALTISGVIIWLPSLRSFSLRVIPRSSKRADLVGAHRNLGILMALPIILIALTGAAIAFTDQTRWMLAKAMPSGDIPKPPIVGPGQIVWEPALLRAQAAFPDANIRLVIWPKKPTEPITIRLRQADEWHPNGRTLVWIDPRTSQIVGQVDALKLKAAQSVFNAIYPLHAAKLGEGVAARLLDLVMALTGLSLGALGLLGAFSFIRTLASRKKPMPRHLQA